MRKKFKSQGKLLVQAIDEIEVPLEGRNRLYPILRSLQELYVHRRDVVDMVYKDLVSDYQKTSNELIEPILTEFFPSECELKLESRQENKGAPGMSAWEVLVMIVIRTGLGSHITFDDLADRFNHHDLLREFLEIDKSCDSNYTWKQLHINYRKVSESTIKLINEALLDLAVSQGFEDGKQVRGDSYVCKTYIHYPADHQQLLNATDKVVDICKKYCKEIGGWRKSKDIKKKLKSACRNISQSKRGGGKDKVKKQEKIRLAHLAYLERVEYLLKKAFDSLKKAENQSFFDELCYSLCCAEELRSLIERRIVDGEEISNSEKIHSIYEPHTELINRGKFPIPYEFGHRILYLQGKSGLILSHKVMENGVLDQDELLPSLERLSKKYGQLDMATFDKGYIFEGLFDNMPKTVINLVIPQKGRGTKESREREASKEFIKARFWRSGIEACISAAARGSGATRCPDKGIRAFRVWTSAVVLSRNLLTYGRLLMEKDLKELGIERKKKKIA